MDIGHFVPLLVGLIVASKTVAHEDKRDQDVGSLDKEGIYRIRRNVDQGQQAAIAQQQQDSPPITSPILQASYFLGQCVMCPPNDPGPRGESGPQGMPGPQGVPGRDGRDQLIIGPIGEHTIHPPPTSAPGGGSSSSSGVTYTRWGKTTCPSTSQLVYEGVMGSGNDHTQKGSGVNYLCMPLEPTFADTPPRGGSAYIYGVEYERSLIPSRNLVQSEAPCVVCLAPSKGTVIVVPAANTCPGAQNWTLEYHGYLMSSHYTFFKSEFVCMDLDSEGIPRTSANNNEALLYTAEAKCSASGGGLPCPPYVDGNNIMCAVCSL